MNGGDQPAREGKGSASVEPGGSPELAAEFYKAGLGYQDSSFRLAQQGNRQRAIEEHHRAIEEYRRAIKARANYPDAHENLGVSLYYTGQFDAAIEAYRIALEQRSQSGQGESAQLFTNYGLALFDAGRYKEAASAFGRALAVAPNDYDLYVHRGFALHDAGEIEAATADYLRYLELAPSGEYASDIRRIVQGKLQPPTTSGQPLVPPTGR
jgi:tetratricopeptide (TPR) repeat protein